MTSSYGKKRSQFVQNDISVIVDNYVEIGDFFVFFPYFAKSHVIDF